MQEIDRCIERYLTEMDTADRQPAEIAEARTTRLKEKMATLKARMEQLKEIQSQLDQSSTGKISLTDPDARAMATSTSRGLVGYNVQTAVDTQGLPHAIAVTTAEVTDRKGALLALGRCAADLQAVQSILADGGYIGQPFAHAVEELLGARVQIAKRSELHTFAVMPQRWGGGERSFAWIEKCRRLWKNCERKLNTSLQFIHLAFLALLLRRS